MAESPSSPRITSPLRKLSIMLLLTAGVSAAHTDPTHLPIGDGQLATAPTQGRVFSCQTRFGGGGAQASGDWINGDGSFDFTRKPTVDGEVEWPSRYSIETEGAFRVVRGNDLPSHPTGIFPVSPEDDAHAFDRNPNRIRAQDLVLKLPRLPSVAATSGCLGMGPVGFMLSGAVIFNALDARGQDAVAHEIQDACQGHPERSGSYHYHSLSTCIEKPAAGEGHSPLVGYALDGFGIYGYRGEDGQRLGNEDLDACHGHTHEIDWDGEKRVLYHYHATLEYPYLVGCFRGTPARPEGYRN